MVRQNGHLCPNCLAGNGKVFYSVRGVPVHDVMLLHTREEALDFPTGDIELTFCRHCGFIYNRAFEPDKLRYSSDCEETQGFSPAFQAFHERLASDLIERHDLREKRIVEIGCGKGDFLNLLCRLGGNSGTGFDPSYRPERDAGSSGAAVTFIRDLYSEKYANHLADFICCKMTLEHIPDTASFIGTIRRSLDGRPTTVFFQVPDMARILEETAFWDIYYEHSSYFTAQSISYLFRSNGFEVERVWTDYDGQYLMLDARASAGVAHVPEAEAPDLAALEKSISRFERRVARLRGSWKERFLTWSAKGMRAALWGGGSKAVAFLTTLGIGEEVAYVVDINPYKRNTFLAGSGHRVVGPEDLPEAPPDVVVIMNPYYRNEIKGMLDKKMLYPELMDITHYN